MHRREVLRLLAIGAGAQCLESLGPEQVLALGRAVHARRRQRGATAAALHALDAHANATITGVAERIIPASETPGATEAGVTAFIDHMLADWYTPAERERVLDGLRELDGRARTQHGADFVDCTETDQVALLAAVDDEVTALRRAPRDGMNPNDHLEGVSQPDHHARIDAEETIVGVLRLSESRRYRGRALRAAETVAVRATVLSAPAARGGVWAPRRA